MWSKTKKKLEDLLCDSLKERLEYHCSNYRMHDGIGRTYITIDKKEVLNMCTLKRDYYRKPKDGVYSQVEFIDSVYKYFDLSIEEAQKSEDPIIRMLGVLDRRTGKRTLESMKPDIASEYEVVSKMYIIRCNAEGINLEL